MMNGLRRYVEDSGYSVKRLEYQGLRRVLGQSGSETPPDIDWMMDNVKGNTLVLLGVGWYDKDGAVYTRDGGHWITLAGHINVWDTIYITDPSSRSDNAYGPGKLESVPMERMSGSELVRIGTKNYSANNIYELTGCLLYTSPSPRDQRGSRMPSSA